MGAVGCFIAMHVQPLQRHQGPVGDPRPFAVQHAARQPAAPAGDLPRPMAPIVRVGADGERELVMARWGMPGPPSSAASR